MKKNSRVHHKHKVVIFSEIEWGFLKQRHQILAEYLLENGYEVEFVQKVPSRIPNPRAALKFLFKIRRDQKAITTHKTLPIPAGLKLSYSRFLPASNTLFCLYNRYFAAPHHAKSLRNGTAYLFSPSASELVSQRDKHDFKIVFDIIHNWWNLPWANSKFKKNTNTLLKTADAVICDSKPLADHLKTTQKTDINVVTPGVGDFWVKKLTALRKKTEHSKTPKVVFFGNLRENSDIGLFKILGEAGITLDAYGSATEGVERQLNGLVNFKPALDQNALLDAICHYDFSLLPYANDEFSKWISPAKYFEVLALGMPIITRSNLNHMPGWNELTFKLDINSKPIDQQLIQIQSDYSKNNLADVSLNLAKNNTWSHQLNIVQGIIESE